MISPQAAPISDARHREALLAQHVVQQLTQLGVEASMTTLATVAASLVLALGFAADADESCLALLAEQVRDKVAVGRRVLSDRLH